MSSTFEQPRPATRLERMPSHLLIEGAFGVAIFAVALWVYNATLAPSLSYASLDGNELATIPYELGLAHSPGYPVYTWVGKLFTFLPIGDIAHRVNLMSAVGAAGGAATLFGIVLLLIRGGSQAQAGSSFRSAALIAAASGALLFAFSTTLWSQATIAEVYAPNIFMFGLTILLLLIWARREEGRGAPRHADGGSLALFGFFGLVFGLSMGAHLSNLALVPAFVLFIVLTNPRTLLQPKLILSGALGFGLGALQFAWLPYKAGELNDPFLARNTPDDWAGIYNYTLNSFTQFRWAYPLEVLPDRITLYFGLVLDNFRLVGGLLALVGGWAMVSRHPKAFLLLVTAYLTETIFFLEYAAPDIDVFFLPAHFILAVFAAFGGYFLLESAMRYGRRLPRAAIAAPALVVIILAGQPFVSLAQYWDDNDQSMNTGINDFYKVAFERLPEDSILLGQSGVFGYDMFYYPLVYDVRPDVDIPAAEGPGPAQPESDGPVFTTTPGGGRFGGGGLFGNTGAGGEWYWPLIASPVTEEGGGSLAAGPFGNRTLVLYETKDQPPDLFAAIPTSAQEVDVTFGALTLVAFEVNTTQVLAGETVHLTLYWEGDWTAIAQTTISTQVGDAPYVEAHQLGFGSLTRYLDEVGEPAVGSLLVEEYDLVVLSSLGSGDQPLRIRASTGADGEGETEWTELATMSVQD